MVFGSIALLALIGSQGGPTAEQAQARLIAFRDSIASQGLGNGIVTPLLQNLELAETRPDRYFFWADNWRGAVSRTTGRVDNFRVTSGIDLWGTRWPSNAISEERCKTLALAYFHAAGWEEDDLLFREVVPAAEQFNNKSQEAVWRISAQRVHNGVVIDWRHPVELELEPTTGQLASFLVDSRGSELSEPRVPSISLAAARQAMVAEVFRQFRVGTLEESIPMYLCAFDPSHTSTKESDFSSAIAVQALRQGKVLLAWDCEVHITDGPRERWARVVIHARSGQLLYIERENGSIGGGKPPKAAVPFRWDWGVGPVEVLASGKAWSTAAGDIENAKPPKTPGKAWVPIVLRRARVLVQAEFDPQSGLVRTRGTARTTYGGPNRSLLDKLRLAGRR